MSILENRKQFVILMLCIGSVQIASYYLAGMFASPDGGSWKGIRFPFRRERRSVQAQLPYSIPSFSPSHTPSALRATPSSWPVFGSMPFFISFSSLVGDRPFGNGLKILAVGSWLESSWLSLASLPSAPWPKAILVSGWLPARSSPGGSPSIKRVFTVPSSFSPHGFVQKGWFA